MTRIYMWTIIILITAAVIAFFVYLQWEDDKVDAQKDYAVVEQVIKQHPEIASTSQITAVSTNTNTKEPVKVVEPPVITVPSVDTEITADNIFILVNYERVKQNLAPLHRNAKLDQAAQMKLDDELAKGYFAHVSPEGKNHQDWINAVGYEFANPSMAAGENLARGFDTPQETVKAWMNSLAHRLNLLSSVYTETGIAVSGNYVVQIFAGPSK